GADMEAMGHVTTTAYVRYIESIQLEWMFSAGQHDDPKGHGPVIVTAFCTFIRQLEYPGTVLARHYVAEPGRTSFETYATLERSDDPGVLYATGGAKMVWTDYARKKALPLRRGCGRWSNSKARP